MTDRAAAEAKAREFIDHATRYGGWHMVDQFRLAGLLMSWGEKQRKDVELQHRRTSEHAGAGLRWMTGCDAYPQASEPAYSFCRCPKLEAAERAEAALQAAQDALRAIMDDAGTHTISKPDVRRSGFGFIYRMAGFGLGLWADPLAALSSTTEAQDWAAVPQSVRNWIINILLHPMATGLFRHPTITTDREHEERKNAARAAINLLSGRGYKLAVESASPLATESKTPCVMCGGTLRIDSGDYERACLSCLPTAKAAPSPDTRAAQEKEK